MPIYISAEGLAPSEIYEQWMSMEEIHARAVAFVKNEKAAADAAMESTDPDVKAKFATRMDILSENMCVLDAWCAVVHAAWIFQTHGSDCLFFEGTDHETTFELYQPDQDSDHS